MPRFNDEDLHRRALDKVLQEISDTMDEADSRRLRDGLEASDNPSAENPIDPANLAVDGAKSEAELEGAHAGDLAAGDVDEAEGGPRGDTGPEEASAVSAGEREIARAASEGGHDTRPGYLDGGTVPDVDTESRSLTKGENADNAGVLVKGDAGKGGEAAPGQPEEYISPWNRQNPGAAQGLGGRRRRFR